MVEVQLEGRMKKGTKGSYAIVINFMATFHKFKSRSKIEVKNVETVRLTTSVVDSNKL